MITAKNYAAQAYKGLAKLAIALGNSKLNQDAEIIKNMARMIKDSIHFAIEDNGKIFNDGLRGIKDTNIRLPYNTITVEYYVSDPKIESQAMDEARKRVILATEIPASILKALGYLDTISHIHEADIFIMVACAYESDSGHWMASPTCSFVPTNWSEWKSDDLKIIGNIEKKAEAIPSLTAVMMPEAFNSQAKALRLSSNEMLLQFALEAASDTRAMAELVEALSCSNVSESIHQKECKSINARREKKGKVPIWETKILTIDTKQEPKSGTTKTGGHASPKQHLRRGHIRRVADKNIWVNSCVVGDRSNGVIEKQYRVK